MSIGKPGIIEYLTCAYSSFGMAGLEDAVEKKVLFLDRNNKKDLDERDVHFVLGVLDTLDGFRTRADFPSIWSLTYGPIKQEIQAIPY